MSSEAIMMSSEPHVTLISVRACAPRPCDSQPLELCHNTSPPNITEKKDHIFGLVLYIYIL